MKRVVLIDLNAIFRKWYSVGERDPVNQAVSKTVAEVHDFAGHGDHAVVCLDSPPYKRRELFAEYKAHRDKQPQVMYGLLDTTIAELRAAGMLVVGSPGYEADDIIASYVAKLPADVEVEVASADKDLLQLVSPRVFVVSTATGVMMREDDVVKKFAVPPRQIAEYLALVGDASDGIPGVKGVGPVGAAGLLKEFGSLKGIYGSISKVKPKTQQALIDAAESVKLSAEKLIPLMTDAPVDVAAVFAERKAQAAAPSAPPPPDEDEPPAPTDDDAPDAGGGEPAQAAAVPPAAAATPDTNRAGEPAPRGATEQVAAAKAAGEAARAAAVPEAGAPTAPPPDPPRLVQGNGHAPPFEMGLEPKNQLQAWDLAMRLYNSKVFQAYPTAEALYAAIITGRELGLPAMAAVRAFHVMENKLTLAAWTMVGCVVGRRDVCVYLRCSHSDERSATWETLRVGAQKPREFTYTIEEADQAGLLRQSRSGRPSNWMLRPKDMLSKTAASKLAREVYSDIIQGLYSDAEMEGVAA